MALIKLRNLPASQPGDFTGQNLLAVALNDENLDTETKSFTCGEMISGMMQVFSGNVINILLQITNLILTTTLNN